MNKIYATDIGISGSAEFASITTSMLNVTGNAEITGTTTLGNVNASGTLTLTGRGSVVSTTPPLIVGGTANQTHIRMGIDEIQARSGSNNAPLYLNYRGGKVYLSNGYNIVADNGTFTANKFIGTSATINNIMVTDTLRSFKWDIQTIANLGGSFIVAPTLECSSSSTITVAALSGNATYNFTGTLTDSAISDVMGGATWSAGSKLKISGKINGVVINTCDGEIVSVNTTSHVLTFRFKSEDASAVSNVSAADLTIMLTTVGSYPIGIYMTSYDENKYSHISLYGGTAADPVVRIGNLQGLPAVNGVSPNDLSNKWGIYTSNGFFAGTIVSNAGKIGKFTITDALYTTAKAFGTTDNNVYIGDDGISLGKTFKVTKAGALTSTSGTIGGWTIGTSAIYKTTNSMTSTGVGLYLGTDGIRNYKDANTYVNVTDGKITAKAVDLTGAIYATSGTIGSDATSGNRWQIGAKSIYNTTSSMTSTGVGTYVGVDGIRNYKDANTYVNIQNGVITAKAVDLTGSITATSGTIGGCTINSDGVLQVPAANITGQLTANQIDASGITIGQSQVTNLSTALGNKADATTVTTLSNKVSAVYGTSNTAVGSAAKTVTCANFELFNGALITVKFTYANTSSGTITLNVNSKGAKNVWVANAVTAADNQLLWGAGAVITFRYDGTQFVVIGEPRLWYGTCSIGAATADKSSTIKGCVICKGTTVALSMTNDNTATAPTLNISDTGVKNLYAGNGTIRPLTSNGLGWTAGSTTEFVFDGQYWRVGDTAGLARATESAKTATSYITYVNATDGIKVHNASDTTNYVQLNSNGMLVYKGGTQVAKFSDTIVLGNASKTHSEITSGGFIVKDYNQSTMTFIGTLNNTSGVAEIVEKQEIVPKEIWTDNGPIEGYGVDLSSICTQIINVEYNGSSITSQVQLYDDSTIFIKNATSSYNGKLLSVKYQTSEIIPVIRFGSENNCTSLYSGAFGQTNGVFGKCSYAFGSGCTVIGDYSFAEGADTYSRDNSHAEGLNTRAVNTSHAEGSFTLAQNGSHAEGNATQATGSASHAEGQDCIARGAYSHASGLGTLAISKSQTVIGEYNTRDDSGVFAFIIGNGTASDDRHNAFAIAWDGTPRGQMVQHNVGTTFTLSAGVIPGFVTNNTVVLTLTTERFLDTVSTITVSTLKGGLRGVQGFLDGSAYNTNWKTSAYTVSASKLSRRHIEIRIEKNSGNFTNLVTNSPVAFYVNPTLTLNFS